MKTTVSNYDFHQAFRKQGRADNFTREGLNIIFNYLEELEEDTGQEIELDVVGICCEYIESDCADVFNDYNLEDSTDDSNEELADIARDFLNDNTVILGEYVNAVGANVFVFAQF
jgi:hypothetical protein